jgi:hypothetical protein
MLAHLPFLWASEAPVKDADSAAGRPTAGIIDRSVVLGWRVFHSMCYGCHGVDATGTSVAPDLTQRVKDMSARHFSLMFPWHFVSI